MLGAALLCGVVDRVEDDVVVLVSRGGPHNVARRALPAGVREGDVIDRGRIDAAATSRRRAKTRALLRRLRAIPVPTTGTPTPNASRCAKGVAP